jgi:hypothetical protein
MENRLKQVAALMAHAVEQYGFADREYKITFGASSPTVYVYDQDRSLADGLIAEVWLSNAEVKVRKNY